MPGEKMGEVTGMRTIKTLTSREAVELDFARVCIDVRVFNSLNGPAVAVGATRLRGGWTKP